MKLYKVKRGDKQGLIMGYGIEYPAYFAPGVSLLKENGEVIEKIDPAIFGLKSTWRYVYLGWGAKYTGGALPDNKRDKIRALNKSLDWQVTEQHWEGLDWIVSGMKEMKVKGIKFYYHGKPTTKEWLKLTQQDLIKGLVGLLPTKGKFKSPYINSTDKRPQYIENNEEIFY